HSPLSGQAEILDEGLGVGAHLGGVVVLAAGGAVIPLIGTEEDVVAVVAHGVSVRAAPESGKALRSADVSKRDRSECLGPLDPSTGDARYDSRPPCEYGTFIRPGLRAAGCRPSTVL